MDFSPALHGSLRIIIPWFPFIVYGNFRSVALDWLAHYATNAMLTRIQDDGVHVGLRWRDDSSFDVPALLPDHLSMAIYGRLC